MINFLLFSSFTPPDNVARDDDEGGNKIRGEEEDGGERRRLSRWGSSDISGQFNEILRRHLDWHRAIFEGRQEGIQEDIGGFLIAGFSACRGTCA